MKTAALEAAFRATTYRVETPTAVFDLRIDQSDPAFEGFLARQGVSCWGIVTACNPGGVLTPDQNAARTATMLAKITECGWRFYPASNHADAGDWPVEPGFCILESDEAALCALAADFGQAAVVCGESGIGSARLVWIDASATQ